MEYTFFFIFMRFKTSEFPLFNTGRQRNFCRNICTVKSRLWINYFTFPNWSTNSSSSSSSWKIGFQGRDHNDTQHLMPRKVGKKKRGDSDNGLISYGYRFFLRKKLYATQNMSVHRFSVTVWNMISFHVLDVWDFMLLFFKLDLKVPSSI